MAKLIILRGPSGSGKSTVAKTLHKTVFHKTALIEQDHYRHVMFNNSHSDLEAARQVMLASVQAALANGYDVILEGILSMGKYKLYFDRLFESHPKDNYLFYLNVSFEEAVRRHATRDKSQHFGENEMSEWYARAAPTGYPGEHIITEDLAMDQVCQTIIQTAALKIRNEHI